MRRARVRPASALSAAGYRVLTGAAWTRVCRRSERSSRALAVALRTAALGAIPPEERAWIERIEAHRSRLPADVVAVSGGRGGSRGDKAEQLSEAAAACEWMSMPPAPGRFLCRLVRELAPRSCLELGTGFGVSTAYQAAALELNERGRMISLDVGGMTGIAAPALERLGLAPRVELMAGRIEDTLARARDAAAPIDYALLDADHTEAGTLDPFDSLLPHLADDALVVFDDINWTDEMRRSWRRVRARPGVRATFTVHRLGIAIIRPLPGRDE